MIPVQLLYAITSLGKPRSGEVRFGGIVIELFDLMSEAVAAHPVLVVLGAEWPMTKGKTQHDGYGERHVKWGKLPVMLYNERKHETSS